MRKAFFTMVLIFGCFFTFGPAHAFSWDEIENLKKSVVNVQVNSTKFFGGGLAGSFRGTGFVVDKAAGLVLTNRHVVDENPSQVEITFYDGSKVFAKPLYYDAWHGFTILQFDPKLTHFAVSEVVLGSYFDLKLGDDVLLIGNNDAEEYSVKEGRVVQLTKNKGARHSQTIQTSFDRTGGSSGSPVWDQQGKVVALHFAGTETSSFELPIDYAKDKLALIQSKQQIKRGDVGVMLDLILIEDAKKYLNLSDAQADEVRQGNPDVKFMIQVSGTLYGFDAKTVLQSGDLILSVNGQPVRDNLYVFDKMIDDHAKGVVDVSFVRFGKIMTAKLAVQDAEALKIKTFALFGGGTFHDISTRVLAEWNVQQDGVVLSQMEAGTSLASVGYTSQQVANRKALIVTRINGQPVRNLEDFTAIVKTLKTGSPIAIVYNDYYDSAAEMLKMVTLDNTLSATSLMQYNASTLSWEPVLPQTPTAK